MADASWDNVTVIRKTQTQGKVLRSESAVTAAKRAGVAVTTAKRSIVNPSHSVDGQKLAKIDREADEGNFHVEKVQLSVAKTIQKARQDKGLTQKELATAINEKPGVVNEYEAGKAVPNQQVLGKLERALGVKLRGKDIGQPLAPRGKPKQ